MHRLEDLEVFTVCEKELVEFFVAGSAVSEVVDAVSQIELARARSRAGTAGPLVLQELYHCYWVLS